VTAAPASTNADCMLAGRRMVLATETRVGTTGEGLANGFRADGWCVHQIDPRQFFPNPRTPVRRLVTRLMRTSDISAYNSAIVEAVEQLRPQAFVTVKGVNIQPETLLRIGRMGAVTVNYYPDRDFDHLGLQIATLSLYHAFFTTKSYQLPFLQKLRGATRTSFLHHGYCDLVHIPHFATIEDHDYFADITYVGNYSPYKEQWLRTIAHRLSGIRLRIVGSRWDYARDPAVKNAAIGHVLSGDFCAPVIQLSKINVAVHGDRNKVEGWQDLVSTRTFEIPACKGFMLHIDNREVRELFERGREIDTFADENELIEKIVYYLARPELRHEMIERAYARGVPAYGYKARAAALSRHIDGLLGTRTIIPPNAPAAEESVAVLSAPELL